MVATAYLVLTQTSRRMGAMALVALTLTGLLGCQPSASEPAKSDAASASAGLIRADAKKLSEIIASHRGQVVLVDFWATWCEPCVANFPHTVELAGKYGPKGLATISVSFDLLEDEPKARKFLDQQGAKFENLISQHNSIGQKPAADFDVGALPVYRLYDRQGKLNQMWEGMPEGTILEDKIQELLASPPDAGNAAASPAP